MVIPVKLSELPVFVLLFLKRINLDITQSLLMVFVVATIPQFNNHATIGTADLILGLYFFICVAFINLWLAERKNTSCLIISFIAMISCIWTKNEGVALSLIAIMVLGIGVLTGSHKTSHTASWGFLFYLAGWMIVVALVFYIKTRLNLINENFNVGMLTVANAIKGIQRLPLMLYEFQKQIFGFKKWNIFWLLPFVFIIFSRRSCFKADRVYLLIAAALFISFYMIVYIFTVVDIDFLLRTTFSRFLLHILPVTALWMAYNIKDVGERRQR